MKNLSLKFKLYALSGFLILLSILVGVVGYVSETKIIYEYSYVAERNLPNIKSIGLMISRYRLARIIATELVIEGLSKDQILTKVKDYKAAWDGFEVEHKKYLDIEFATGELELYNKFKHNFTEMKVILDEVVKLAESGVKENNFDQKRMTEIIQNQVVKLGDSVRNSGNALLKFHEDRADWRTQNATSIANASTVIILFTILIGAILGALFSIIFSSTLVNTLSKISQALNTAGLEVSSGSSQIASSSQELSQSTTEQSASLSQTAAAIDEMNSMVQKSSENAKKTFEYAVSSKESAINGKEVVLSMISTIDEISQSNQDIMAAVNESNQKMEEIVKVIGEIENKTKVINDIVFQTKLLSFNASVEAARAGEMGKGFAVVAQEVGSLAEMSGKSAKEISDMLSSSMLKVNEIVKETKAKVETLIEVGKQKVESGNVVARKCGEVLDIIVVNVDDVNKLASEISHASEEQAKGIQEIAKAAGMLETVTQQNSTASEQSAKAAEELSQQAFNLNLIVSELHETIRGKSNVHEVDSFRARAS